MKRVAFYFDGFNFYNGFKEKTILDPTWKNYYWLDFSKFCNEFLHPNFHELVAINYFTAPPQNQEKRSKQSALFSANKLLNPGLFRVIEGNYQNKSVDCKLCKKSFTVPEEKRTDVSIAVSMVMDCCLDLVDMLMLVSADSDQIPTIKTIQKYFPKKELKLYFPPERKSTEMYALVKPIVFLNDNEEKFKNAIMPQTVESDDGKKKYVRPSGWKF